ncbi:hypothetical protein BH09ACT10_BH09ACT10_27040 [soil metagenome]
MTIYITRNLTDEAIAELSEFDAFRLAEELLEDSDPRDAARVLRSVVASSPRNAAAWELLGRAYFAAALLPRAESAFRTLIDLEPTNGWAHLALARTLDRANRKDEAATFRRLAEAMGATGSRASRVELTDGAGL